jgi:rubredoxin
MSAGIDVDNPTLAAYERDEDQEICCPECGTDITDSKGSQPLPDVLPVETTHGWACEPCDLVFPSRVHGPKAPSFIPAIVGLITSIETLESDSEKRWIPVPKQ